MFYKYKCYIKVAINLFKTDTINELMNTSRSFYVNYSNWVEAICAFILFADSLDAQWRPIFCQRKKNLNLRLLSDARAFKTPLNVPWVEEVGSTVRKQFYRHESEVQISANLRPEKPFELEDSRPRITVKF